jgi:hypothetical protein
MYFDTKCLASCKCQFEIGKINPKKLKSMAKNLELTLDDSSEFFEARIREFKDIVEPRIDNYLKKERALHNRFGDLLEKHAVETFGCDRQCIDTCVKKFDENEFFVSFWEIPMCVKDCECSLNELFKVENKPSKRINFHHVMRDADKESWDLFQQKKDLWLD